MFEALSNAVALGMAKVTRRGGGYLVHGARGDMLMEGELERVGAEWRDSEGAYFVHGDAAAKDMRRMERRSKVAAKAIAARAAKAREQGIRLFDNQRARQQRKVTREIRAMYERAMAEHAADIASIERILSAGRPEGMDAAEWAATVARRRNTLAELEAVYDSLAAGLSKAGESSQMLMSARLQESAAIGRKVAAWQIDNMAGVNVTRFIASDTATLALTGIGTYHGKYDLKAWQGVADRKACRETIRKAVSRGLLTGEHPERIARRIEGVFDGTEPLSPHKRAVRIARTETASIMSEAAQETMRAANDSGVRVLNRWDATLDGKTRDSHRAVDGEVREVGEKFSNGLRRVGDGGPADRINCRCCMTPVLEGFEPDSPLRRDNESGEMLPYMTYAEWERTRGKELS